MHDAAQLVAGSTYVKFVVSSFYFQLTFTCRVLVSSLLRFAYKYSVPSLATGIKSLGVISPSSFSLCDP